MPNETEMELFVASYLISLLFSLGISLISYVFTSLGYHTLAKRRGIKHAWLAWIPVGNYWILGSLSDQYRYVVKGRVTNRRKVLLGLYIAAMVLSALMIALTVNIIIEAIPLMDQFTVSEVQLASIGMKALGMLAVCLVVLIVSIVAMVFMYIAVYDVFRSCDPSTSVLFLVLTILLGVVYPFFVFASRNKDLGMPARTAVPQQPVWETPQPVQAEYQPNRVEGDPWENNPEN